eukprot:1943807-Pyramimonas_sp.AAC.1
MAQCHPIPVRAVSFGSFVVAKLGESDGKVNGEVYQVLYADHVKQFKKEPGIWPPEFDDAVPEDEEENVKKEDGYSDGSDDGLPPLEENTNHRRMVYNDDDESSEDDR